MEADGTYITAGQMQFYLNRPQGQRNFESGTPNFMEYYNICRVYNVISDLMDEDEDCAMLYWDHKKDRMAMAYPSSGPVSTALSLMEPTDDDEDDEDDEDDMSQYNLYGD